MIKYLGLAALLCASLTGVSHSRSPAPVAFQQALASQPAATRQQQEINNYVAQLYDKMDYQLIWEDSSLRQQIEDSVRDSYRDGLNPVDYRLPPTTVSSTSDTSSPQTQEQRIRQDIQRSRALMMLLSHLYYGKVDPTSTHADWNLADLRQLDKSENLVFDAVQSGDITGLVEIARPQSDIYHRLKAQLDRYRAIEAAGGWPQLATGRVLTPGMHDPLFETLRSRLTLSGDYPPGRPVVDQTHYDTALVEAVKAFQTRHLLDADGIIGADTLQALNIPVQLKVDQIRANLERMRWALKGLEGNFLLVDIAGYQLHLIEQSQPVWSSPIQVGQPFRETPVFNSRISYLEWNPTWTAPPTIVQEDLLPAIKRDPGYLQRKNMVILNHAREEIDPASIDWSRYPDEEFPYLIRQLPGPINALGTVKFIFPNKHLVFLHDTPSKHLFSKSNRAFSSGCIRVGKPYDLAKILLAGQTELSDQDIQDVLDSKTTRRDHLQTPFPIVLLYWTTKWTEDGTLVFAPDVYQRDAKIVAALNQSHATPDAHHYPR